jgi:electron transport complex protein RnfG
MAKKKSNFINMVFTLFAVTLVASTALGLVFQFTKEPINEAKTVKTNFALSRVLPPFDNNPRDNVIMIAVEPDYQDTLYLYPAYKDNMHVGTAVETFSKNGFGGLLKIIVGFKPDGTIYNIAVIEHHETPGLGDKILKYKSDWSEQFNEKNPKDFKLYVKKEDGDVDAITASTITSSAFCEAVKLAYDTFIKEGEKK